MNIKPLSKALQKRLERHQVPGWARGVWKRTRLRLDGDGVRGGTRIIWVQTPILFADIRSPAPKDTDGEAEGFSGHLVVTGMVCSWQRPIDLQPPREPGDEGAMFRDGDVMLEAGIHANYIEDWNLVGQPEPHLAMSRGRFDVTRDGIVWAHDEPLEIVVACDGHVIHAWRGQEGAGLAYYLHNRDTDTLRPRHAVGVPVDDHASGIWSVWSTDMRETGVMALADMLG